MLFIETPSNPGLDIVDLEAAGAFCRHNNLIFNIDNCFATPYLQQPARFGADLITHSATKFIDGQGRVMGGLVAGRADLMLEVKKFCRSTGPALSPFNAWLLSKSLETLASTATATTPRGWRVFWKNTTKWRASATHFWPRTRRARLPKNR
jgi:O-succinylhomoserine sulfhydrylase